MGIKYIFVLITCLIHIIGQHSPFEIVTLDDFSSDNLIIKGTYNDIISSYGIPKKKVDFKYTIHNEAQNDTIECTYIAYENHSYVCYKDSVQLDFVDLKRSHYTLRLKDIHLDANTDASILVWYLYLIGKGNIIGPEGELFSHIEGHYCTYNKVKILCLGCTHDMGRPISICFSDSLLDKRLWYIEFPIIIPHGIVWSKKSCSP